jgi:hypothetical protein
LSPSISLSSADIDVEEYSCYVFPAFKALEAFLLSLLLKKGILVSERTNFGSVFTLNTENLHILNSRCKNMINDTVYENCVEDIYNYFKRTRHIYFHANQILTLINMIDNKIEADEILNDILLLINETALKIL